MSRVLLIIPASRQSGLTAVCIGLARALADLGLRVAYVKPITGHTGDRCVAQVRAGTGLAVPAPLAQQTVDALLAQGDEQILLEQVVTLCSEAGHEADVTLVEGLALEADEVCAVHLNTHMVKALDAEPVLVMDVRNYAPAALASAAVIAARSYGNLTGRQPTMLVATHADEADTDHCRAALEAASFRVLGLIPCRCLHGEKLSDAERAQSAVAACAGRIDATWPAALVRAAHETRITPPAFRQRLIAAARAAGKRIVLPEGSEPRTIAAAAIAQERGIARCVLLGDPAEISRVAQSQGLHLPATMEIIDVAQVAADYIAPLMERRKAKGLTRDQAIQELSDPIMVGTMMMALDEVDGLVSGAVHTTAHTIRPALQIIKTAPGNTLVSSVFFMCLPDQMLVFGDCAVNPQPTSEQLADIAIQSADSARAFGLPVRVAMLSYSTGTSGAGADVERVKQATVLVQQRRPDLLIDGPLQYDAALVPEVARQKAPASLVAGRATVLIFPDLNSGNIAYKAVQRAANVVSMGPMLQGLAKPVNDLSRGCLVEDIVFTIALTAVQAQQAAERARL